MDIFLQPLIVELNQLWEFGVQTFGVQRRQNFQMKAALMWTINDFPAYSMLSGWSTSGRLACPQCMENTEAFTLKGSRKQSWFDCHRKFLPRGHLYRRNTTHFRKGKTVNKEFGPPKTGEELLAEVDSLGFMKAYEIGAEKNNTAKSENYGWNKKNHAKSREELNDICSRLELAKDPVTGRFPKAMYALDRDGKKALLEWIKLIKFPNGYASNLSRCVDTIGMKMHGMKSHDCHIFMQRLLPIALRELLPKEMWEPIIELSIFFRELTSTSLTEKDLDRMSLEILKILCKLEQGDPMIPERLQRNEVSDIEVDYDVDGLSIFKPHRKSVGACRKRYHEDAEIIAARTYVLLNCSEIENYREVFKGELCRGNPEISTSQIEAKFESDFAYWFQQYVQDPTVCTNPFILSLAKGPLRSVRTFKGYRVNGFKFQTQAYGEEQLTMNSGVCVRGTQYVDSENDFYGFLTDIIELEYPALPMKTTVLLNANGSTQRKIQAQLVTKNTTWIKARLELDMPEGIIPAFQDDIEENPLVVATEDNPTYLAD
ncbi:uncharacterized protein LOC126681493 [Mercurialis annua]|uniref:uncharacterized protein LOC126681493 n=1 Tax=Mercurialis annua TaxID=3986 RepID=UPI00216042DB|nr:uncharacterized protein LOC126681493 [Mercurialis annua]